MLRISHFSWVITFRRSHELRVAAMCTSLILRICGVDCLAWHALVCRRTLCRFCGLEDAGCGDCREGTSTVWPSALIFHQNKITRKVRKSLISRQPCAS